MLTISATEGELDRLNTKVRSSPLKKISAPACSEAGSTVILAISFCANAPFSAVADSENGVATASAVMVTMPSASVALTGVSEELSALMTAATPAPTLSLVVAASEPISEAVTL